MITKIDSSSYQRIDTFDYIRNEYVEVITKKHCWQKVRKVMSTF